MPIAIAKCFIAIAAGLAVTVIASWGIAMLADPFGLTQEQLIDNDPRVLGAYGRTLEMLGTAILVGAPASGALATTCLAAYLLPSSLVVRGTASGLIVALAIAQLLLLGHPIFLSIVLVVVWLALLFVGHRIQLRRGSEA